MDGGHRERKDRIVMVSEASITCNITLTREIVM